MATLITDPELEQELIAQRQAWGVDRYDEVWDGVYIMAPMANDEHQYLVKELTAVLTIAVDWAGLGQTRPGVNISDRREDWKTNYRIPDVAVFLNDTKAENCGAFWLGGPDFGIEIISPKDRALLKLPFYANVGASEILAIDRDPWAMTLYRRQGAEMIEVTKSTPEDPQLAESKVLPLNWRLLPSDQGLVIEVTHRDGGQEWLIKIQL